MKSYVFSLKDMDKTQLAVAGGKGANLGELSRIEGIQVPESFRVTTDAYIHAVENSDEFNALVGKLSNLQTGELVEISGMSGKIRGLIEALLIPAEIEEEIMAFLEKSGEKNAYAVRSSATAEDLLTASFTGQQDTYLNTIDRDEILKRVSKCWVFLFTDRAVIYRMQNQFDHHKVSLSVVIQKMVFPQASGILFTADLVTMNRRVTSIDTSFRLDEALVSGLVNADNCKVHDGRIIDKKIPTKKLAIHALKESGTQEKKVAAENQNRQALIDQQILEFEKTGKRIEACFDRLQDIEWCLHEHQLFIVQSRPITTLYPVPDRKDGKNYVYMFFNHQQMMTNVMKPLELSFFQLGLQDKPGKKSEEALFLSIGGGLYFDLAHDLSSPIGRKIVLASMGKIDPLVLNILKSLVKRKGFLKPLSRSGKGFFSMGTGYFSQRLVVQSIKISRDNDASIVPTLMSQNEASIRELQHRMEGLSGEELFAAAIRELKHMKEAVCDPKSMGTVYAGTLASSWINKNMERWLGEKNAADSLSKSVANNITSEMSPELLDVADVVRQFPAAMEYLGHAKDQTFFEDLNGLKGGGAVSEPIQAYLEKYGMRCPGEIDIIGPCFSKQPTALVPSILSNIKNFGPGAHSTRTEQSQLEAKRNEQDLLNRLEQLPGGKQKAKKAREKISILRNFIGYREYPKYLMARYYWIIKQALLREAGKFVQKGMIRERENIHYLSFEELREAVRTNRVDYGIITEWKEEYKTYAEPTPSRVMTSEGEALSGEYDTGNIPKGALAGIPASSGAVEGRARVILKIENAHMEDGDVLVTTFADPSWTPVFVSIKSLVVEVGRMVTRDSVIAREYGLPAVMGVENATKLIKNGQRIRISGTEGYAEILLQE